MSIILSSQPFSIETYFKQGPKVAEDVKKLSAPQKNLALQTAQLIAFSKELEYHAGSSFRPRTAHMDELMVAVLNQKAIVDKQARNFPEEVCALCTRIANTAYVTFPVVLAPQGDEENTREQTVLILEMAQLIHLAGRLELCPKHPRSAYREALWVKVVDQIAVVDGLKKTFSEEICGRFGSIAGKIFAFAPMMSSTPSVVRHN